MFCFCFVIVFRSVFLAFFVSLSRSLQRSLLAAAHPGRILFAGPLFFIYTVLFFSTLGVGCCSVLICLVLILDVLVLTYMKNETLSRFSSWQRRALELQQVHSLLFLFVCQSSFSYLSCTAPTSSRVQPIAAFFVV